MALLWKNAAAFQVQAMPWRNFGGPGGLSADEVKAKPVKKAGYAGFVGMSKDAYDDLYYDDEHDHDGGFDEHAWDHSAPEPTHDEEAHNQEHGEYPESYHERHEQAYGEHLERKAKEDEPDHEDDELHDFIGMHGDNKALWKDKATHGPVNIKGPVYATQSHVGQKHIDRYRQNPGGRSWQAESTPGFDETKSDYLGHKDPLFVTHEGRLHVIEGHHRVAAALQDGKSHIHGWHYDGDKHGLPGDPDEDEDW